MAGPSHDSRADSGLLPTRRGAHPASRANADACAQEDRAGEDAAASRPENFASNDHDVMTDEDFLKFYQTRLPLVLQVGKKKFKKN